MKKLNLILSCLLLVFISISCSDDDDNPVIPETNSIVDIASETSELSTLVSAVQSAGLVNLLDGNGSFTVFAPTNAAFQELLDSNADWNSLDDIPSEVLDVVLKYHVLDMEVESSALSDTYVNTMAMAQGEYISLPVMTTGGVMFDGSTSPIQTDIIADNGIIHIVNKVMLPNNIVQFAVDNPNFSILVAALTDARHTTDFVTILTGDGPFTVFAPTNDAFMNLLDSNPAWNGLDDIPIEVLDAVLKYHVVNGANVQSNQLSDDMTITTLGGDLMTDLSDGAELETSSGQDVDIILTDVQGTNGVIHAIEEVMLP